jgi:hypothetical protein
LPEVKNRPPKAENPRKWANMKTQSTLKTTNRTQAGKHRKPPNAYKAETERKRADTYILPMKAGKPKTGEI